MPVVASHSGEQTLSLALSETGADLATPVIPDTQVFGKSFSGSFFIKSEYSQTFHTNGWKITTAGTQFPRPTYGLLTKPISKVPSPYTPALWRRWNRSWLSKDRAPHVKDCGQSIQFCRLPERAFDNSRFGSKDLFSFCICWRDQSTAGRMDILRIGYGQAKDLRIACPEFWAFRRIDFGWI